MQVVRGRCPTARAVVENHISGLKHLCNAQHLFIAVTQHLGPVLAAYHTEMFAQNGIGVEQQLESVTRIK